MKILIVCVNYNSYAELVKFLLSVDVAFRQSKKKNIQLCVCIADNSDDKKEIDLDGFAFNVKYYAYDNVGYFGGALKTIEAQSDIHENDYVIISNVDLEVDKNLFKNFPEEIDNVAWISPSILSSYEHRDKGLGLCTRPSKTKLQLLKFIYKYPLLEYIMENTIYKRKSFSKRKGDEKKQIYSGHGSFIVLTRNFFNCYPKLKYPVFLFGEELFLAELIRIKGMVVVYDPSLIIYDSEHVSTSRMPSTFCCKCQHDAISYILKTFYA